VFELFNDEVNGPFSSHLETLWYRLPKQPDILKALKEILDKNECKDEKVRYHLEGVGLVRRLRNGRNVQARCKLYETFLKERLRKYWSA
jgi:hypothetical protein